MTDSSTFESKYLYYYYAQHSGYLAFAPSFSKGVADRISVSSDPSVPYKPISQLSQKTGSEYVTVDTVANYVIDDMKALNSSARILGRKSTNYNTNTQLPSDEFMIAVRVSSQDRWNKNHSDWNYHFMRRMGNTSVWRHKGGTANAVIQLASGQTPSTVSWSLIEPILNSAETTITGAKVQTASYYDSDIIYMAVKDNFKVYTLIAKKANVTMGISSAYAKHGVSSTYNIEQPTIQPELAQNKKVTSWSSSNTAVARVDSDGRVTSLKAGTAVITGNLEGIKVSINITVKASSGIRGDANFDGDVSITDCTHIQKYLVETIQPVEIDLDMADANRDGIVSITDSTHIQKYLAGVIPSL